MLYALLSLADAGQSCCTGGVSMDRLILLGAVERTEVEAALERIQPALRECQPGAGYATLKFVIDKHGEVSHVSVKSSNLDEPALDCLIGVGWTAEMPTPKGGGIAILSDKFVFSGVSPAADTEPPSP